MDPQVFIQHYLDGELSHAQFAELSAWLEASEANREAFVRAATLDTDIHRRLAHADLHAFLEDVDIHAIQDAMQCPQADQDQVLLSITQGQPAQAAEPVTLNKAFAVLSKTGGQIAGRFVRQHASAFAKAAVLTIVGIVSVVVVLNQKPRQDALTVVPPPPVTQTTAAYVRELNRVKWAGPAFAPGESLAQGSYELEEGSVLIEMASGAQALIQGPTHFTLTGSNQLALHAGSLDAQVPPRAIGFTVDTPEARIVDIGTEFNIAIDDQDDDTQISVHVGQVLAAINSSTTSVRSTTSLSAGQAMRISADAQMHPIDYVPGGFAEALLKTRYQMQITGGPAFFRPICPDDLRQGNSALDRLQVYLEQAGVALQQEVAVDLQGTDRWPSKQPRVIHAGKHVDVYLLHMDKTGFDTEDLLHRLDFGRPILGVIVRHQNLELSDALADPAGKRRFDSQPDSEGQLLRGIESADIARLLPGGTALEVLFSVKHKTDQIRVLVEALPLEQ